MNRRTLSLKRETLNELSAEQLAAVVGAAPEDVEVLPTTPVAECLTLKGSRCIY